MSRRQQVVKTLEELGAVAVIRLKSPEPIQAVVDALVEGGVRALEITLTMPGAIDAIREVAQTLPSTAVLGAGTVTTEEQARQVIDAGAQFVVSPVFRPRIISTCHDRDIAAMPGCMTPTEILTAWEAGADVVKVFPATALGPQYFKDLSGPLPQVKLMPTGGVSLDNVGDWLQAGAVAVGVGGALLDKQAIANGDMQTISDRAGQFVSAVRRARA